MDDGRLKAEMISMGRVRVPKELLEGYRLSRSTAGPGAGGTSLALGWDGADGREHHIKLAVARDEDGTAPLALVRTDDGSLELRRNDGSLVVADVRMLPIVMHAPGQAFINLAGDCIYECAFCNTHRMEPGRRKAIGPGRWVELVLKAHEKAPFDALAITSVASTDHEGMLQAYERVIRGVLAEHPDMAVGVESYVEGPGDIQRLKDAGATEIKINVQSPDPGILERICPGWDLEAQYKMLGQAVAIFGRGNVTTNIIVGLGETDDAVSQALDRLAVMGVVPTVRMVRVNDGNRQALERALGGPIPGLDADRHLHLARMLHGALDRHGLDAGSQRSMCHRCGCCDLEPGKDV
jgi:hypothetical protein